jgi:hypothetical protein
VAENIPLSTAALMSAEGNMANGADARVEFRHAFHVDIKTQHPQSAADGGQCQRQADIPQTDDAYHGLPGFNLLLQALHGRGTPS